MRTCFICNTSIDALRADARVCRNRPCRMRARAKKMPYCTVHGCASQQWSREFCRNHYEAWRIHGDPLANGNVGRRRSECKEGHPTTEPGQRSANGGCRRCKLWTSTQAWKIMHWTEREFRARMAAQDNRCSICGNEFDVFGKRPRSPNFDHCHVTGRGRGIICHLCNLGIGLLGDDPDRLEAAAVYLRAPLMEATGVWRKQSGDRPV